jgi:hypothetical protein
MSKTVNCSPNFPLAAAAIRKANFFESILSLLLEKVPCIFQHRYPLQKDKDFYFFLPNILYIPVPQEGHLPFIAARPFFIVTCCSSFISLLVLHFTQYPFSAILLPPFML